MATYTFQIFGYDDNPEGITGGWTVVLPSAQPITVSVNDNDVVLNESTTTSGGIVDSNGIFSQLTTVEIVVDGVTIPIGSAVTSNYKTTITNETTGQSGNGFQINFYTPGGYPLANGIAFSIPVSAGDTIYNSAWSNAGQTDYSTFAPLSVGPPPDGYVDGTSGSDSIGSAFMDAQGERIDNNDQILPGASANDDYVRAGDGNDTVAAGAGNDIIYGGNGNDSLDGGAGNDSIYAEAGNDFLIGGLGSDYLDGGTGIDRVSYSGSNAGVNVNLATGTATGGHATGDTLVGIENLLGSAYADTLTGDSGANLLDGGANDDIMSGGGGNDTLLGGTGNDRILGGAGNDSLTLGTGNDIVEFSNGDGQDVITDFNMTLISGKTTDQFDVSDLLDAYGEPVKVWDVTVTDNGSGHARLTFPNGESVVLTGVTPAAASSLTTLNAMGIPCLVAGTNIRVPGGEVAVESLRPGDLVETLDHGPQPLLWTGHKTVSGAELARSDKLRPVRIKAGTLGAMSDLWVSPQHRMVVVMSGHEYLVRAAHLAKLAKGRVRIGNGKRSVSYHHLLFAQHQIIIANGAPTESFYPGRIGLRALAPIARLEVLRRLPNLGQTYQSGASPTEYYGPTARPIAPLNLLDASIMNPPKRTWAEVALSLN